MKYALALALFGVCVAVASAQFNFFGGGNRRPRPGPPPAQVPVGPRAGRSDGRCPTQNPPIRQFAGRNYVASWEVGCKEFSGQGGAAWCQQIGMRAVSLDDPNKAQFFLNEVQRAGERWFWSGGRVNQGQSVTWPNGVSSPIGSLRFWSHTGGLGRPQPDNREGNEFCLAILNNFYQDGVKFHDVACHHEKSVICEA